jgi:hypothetical protein
MADYYADKDTRKVINSYKRESPLGEIYIIEV